jgi:hypothetical protein
MRATRTPNRRTRPRTWVAASKKSTSFVSLSLSLSLSLSISFLATFTTSPAPFVLCLSQPLHLHVHSFVLTRFVSFRFVSFRFVSFRWMADHCTHTNTGDVAVRAGRLDGGGELRRRVSGEARALRPRPRGGERAEEGAGGGRVHGGGQGELPRLQGRLRRPES